MFAEGYIVTIVSLLITLTGQAKRQGKNIIMNMSILNTHLEANSKKPRNRSPTGIEFVKIFYLSAPAVSKSASFTRMQMFSQLDTSKAGRSFIFQVRKIYLHFARCLIWLTNTRLTLSTNTLFYIWTRICVIKVRISRDVINFWKNSFLLKY